MSAQGLIEQCKDLFGTTKNVFDAGYILPDGIMLDFKRKAVAERKKDFTPHGAIARCLKEYGRITYDDAMITFMRETGAIRMSAGPDWVWWEGVAVKPPTASQGRVLSKLCNRPATGFRATMAKRMPCEWSVKRGDGSPCEWASHTTFPRWTDFVRAMNRCRVRR